jgi:TPR repeat protein
MPVRLICCISLPPATITSVPICDFAEANEEVATHNMEYYFSCCGKYVCGGCVYSFHKSGNNDKCPFCNADHVGKTDEERINELMKRVEANDASAILNLGNFYHKGIRGVQQDYARAMELWTQAAELGSSKAHFFLGKHYYKGGDLKKAKFHYETAAMAGHEGARFNRGLKEFESGNKEQAVKHWIIAASAGNCTAMHTLLVVFGQCVLSRESIDSTLTAYNNSCAEMRSEARDAHIHIHVDNIGER